MDAPGSEIRRADRRGHHIIPRYLATCEGRFRYFEHDAAHIFVGEEIVSSQPQPVHSARPVGEEGITVPAAITRAALPSRPTLRRQ